MSFSGINALDDFSDMFFNVSEQDEKEVIYCLDFEEEELFYD